MFLKQILQTSLWKYENKIPDKNNEEKGTKLHKGWYMTEFLIQIVN